jgi:putative glycosyltransferase (TIGR04348 family)
MSSSRPRAKRSDAQAAVAAPKARPRILIVTPYTARTNNGNWQTASRWARLLRGPFAVRVATGWQPGDPAPDLLIALHARRSAPAIAAFAQAHPERPRLVVLTGTDLYRDIGSDADARRSLELATRLIGINACAADALPRRLHAKLDVVLQSATPVGPLKKSRAFTVVVAGHLRDEKNPQLVWRLARGWTAQATNAPLRLVHIGAALVPALGDEAAAVGRDHPVYQWLGARPRGALRQRVARARLLLHPSHMEGGSLAVIEAITAHTPVIASRIPGNVGLLGADYPGLFAADDAHEAAALIERAASDPRFAARLTRASARLAPRFTPAREQATLQRIVQRALRNVTKRPNPRRH